MKRFFCILLSVLLLCTLLSGCKEDKKLVVPGKEESSSEVKPLQVLMEADIGGFHMYSNRKTTLSTYESKTKGFLDVIEELGGPKKKEVSLKFLPPEGTDRDQALSQMQTEIMAGGGPDVFVSFAGTALEEPRAKNGIKSASIYKSKEIPVIPYPQQAMERGMFLNLDDYLPKAQFMKLENLPKPLAEAGQYEGSQYILPMSYTVPLICFDREEVAQPELSKTMTWEEMLEGEPALQAAAANIFLDYAPFLPLIENEKLTFSEEELLEFAMRYKELLKKATAVKFIRQSLGTSMEYQVCKTPKVPGEVFTAVPIYSRRGGYGALVKTYAAINVNTERPDDAFFIVDYLLSEECQTSKFYRETTYGRSVPSMTGDLVLEGFSKEENHKTYCDIRNNIAFAEFDTPLHYEIGSILYLVQENKESSIEAIVHDGYTRMKMLLDES